MSRIFPRSTFMESNKQKQYFNKGRRPSTAHPRPPTVWSENYPRGRQARRTSGFFSALYGSPGSFRPGINGKDCPSWLRELMPSCLKTLGGGGTGLWAGGGAEK